jgi:hypothetical protein
MPAFLTADDADDASEMWERYSCRDSPFCSSHYICHSELVESRATWEAARRTPKVFVGQQGDANGRERHQISVVAIRHSTLHCDEL